MSYSAKFASCFYGPFRWVCPTAGSAPSWGWAGREVCPGDLGTGLGQSLGHSWVHAGDSGVLA